MCMCVWVCVCVWVLTCMHCNKHYDQEKLREVKIQFTRVHNLSIIQRIEGRDLNAGSKAESWSNTAHWLSPYGSAYFLIHQDYLPKGGTAHSVLAPPMPIINQRNVPRLAYRPIYCRHFLSWGSLSSNLIWTKLRNKNKTTSKNINHDNNCPKTSFQIEN